MAAVTDMAPVRPPAYYIRQRLLQNKPAMAGLAVIILAAVVAIFSYALMPDNSPNANNGLVQLQKKAPGFTVQVLRLPKETQPEKSNLITGLLHGRLPEEEYLPIESITVEDKLVRAVPYKSNNAQADQVQTFPLELFLKNEPVLPETVQKRSDKQTLVQRFVQERTYWLGTDKAGRDVLSRLILGTRISLAIGLVAVLISVVIGVVIGAVAGYFGGLTDKLMQFLMTVVWSVPGIMLVIAISLALNSKGVWVSFVAVGLTMWVEVARVVRGQILSLKEKTFVEAARVLGVRQEKIIFKHLLPNMTGPLIVIATANFASAILMEAGLSFLGLGVQPPAPSWGMMVNEGFQMIGSRASLYLVLLPSACISLLVLSFNLLGSGLRDAYDPKTPIHAG